MKSSNFVQTFIKRLSRKTRMSFGTSSKVATLAFFVSSCIHMPQTTAYDPELSRTVVDGYPFHTEVYGNPELPPLIVLHGGPGNDFYYLKNLVELKDSYHILFYDQRGSGLSPRADLSQETFVDTYLNDLNRFVQIHGKGKPVRLIGHSWGAMLAAAYISRHPHKISHVVFVEPGILNRESAIEFYSTLKKLFGGPSMIFRIIPTIAASLFVTQEDGYERMDYVMTKIS